MLKQPQKASHRVILNTGILYAKMGLTIFISLYSTRLILNALGVSDYGIFNVVGGVIGSLAFLQGSLSVSTQRFLSFHQGSKNLDKQKEIFGSSIILHFILGLLILILLCLFQPFIFDGILNIPEERIGIAKVIYLFMVFSTFCTILSVPYSASLNAHENMFSFAIISIVQSFLTLSLAVYLSFSTFDRLILYGLGMCIINIIVLILYYMYCVRNYQECVISSIRFSTINTIKELTQFAGWNVFGALSYISRNQILPIVFNFFLGTVVNAAFGIANQVANQLNHFSATMLKAINPQIMQSEGADNRKRMLHLSMVASKSGFFLCALFAIPVMFEMPAVLQWWLKNVPENTVMFCQMILLSLMISQLTIGLQSAIQATGKIKNYMILVGVTKIIMIPVAFVLLRLEMPILSVMIAYVIFELLASVLRLICLKRFGNLCIREFIRNVFCKTISPVIVIVLTGCVLCCLMSFHYRFLVTIPVMMLSFVLAIYFWGISKNEKQMIHHLVKTVKMKVFK